MTPANKAWGLAPAPKTLVRIHVLVGHCRDFGGVAQQSRDEVLRCLRKVILRSSLEEGVVITLEKRHVSVHA